MRPTTIARNYAEALFELGEQAKQTTVYAQLIDAVAGAIELAPEVQVLLVSPRVPKANRMRVASGFGWRTPVVETTVAGPNTATCGEFAGS